MLEELVAKLGETAHLGVLEDFAVVHLDGLVPDHLLVTPSRVGKRLPAHCTALGKVLLGCADSATRESFLSSVVSVGGLEVRTPATFADSHKLFDELRAVGGQGFSVDLGECEHGLHCAAAPVFGEEGRVVASLSLSGPSIRLTEDAIHREAIPALSSAAARLSRSLGHSA